MSVRRERETPRAGGREERGMERGTDGGTDGGREQVRK